MRLDDALRWALKDKFDAGHSQTLMGIVLYDPLALVIGYRVFVILTGVIVIYLGYRLVRSGDGAAGEIELGWGESRLKMSSATPGVVLMIVGAIVLVANLAWGPKITGEYGDLGPMEIAPELDTTSSTIIE